MPRAPCMLPKRRGALGCGVHDSLVCLHTGVCAVHIVHLQHHRQAR